MFQAGYPVTKRLLNFVYKVSTLFPVSVFLQVGLMMKLGLRQL